ncbi:CopD family protein [Bradyrhizobium liaoningense]|uniref:CopD family protein n=1 Tax=Bradyrhizobium liaoningense TaxID=43992 RepID=UPI001BADD943|nr:CopD family protein [Bradyrhizobium liaoningense]MBR0737346.1 CopD family protein [Bradyrhizobium liaoningense]
MNVADTYVWLKAAHVASALLFIGGVTVTSLTLALLSKMPQAHERFVAGIRRYDRWVTVPAIIGVWTFGTGLAISGSWFGQGWLNVKLGFVVLLSALHGVQSGQLRKIEAGASPSMPRTLPVVVLAAIVIAVLAVAKP